MHASCIGSRSSNEPRRVGMLGGEGHAAAASSSRTQRGPGRYGPDPSFRGGLERGVDEQGSPGCIVRASRGVWQIEDKEVGVRTTRAVTLGSLALLSVWLVACGSGTTVPTAAPSVAIDPGATSGPIPGALDACPLLTAEEVATATGVAIPEVEPVSAPGIGICVYTGEGETRVIDTALHAATAGIDTYLDDPVNEAVAGVGDKAVIFQADLGLPTGRTIYMRKGDRGFILNVFLEGIDDAEARTILVQLATVAANRM